MSIAIRRMGGTGVWLLYGVGVRVFEAERFERSG